MNIAFMRDARKVSHCKEMLGKNILVVLHLTVLWFKDYVS